MWCQHCCDTTAKSADYVLHHLAIDRSEMMLNMPSHLQPLAGKSRQNCDPENSEAFNQACHSRVARRTKSHAIPCYPAYEILNHHIATRCFLQNQIPWVHIAHCTVSRKIDPLAKPCSGLTGIHVPPDQSQLLDLTGESGS